MIIKFHESSRQYVSREKNKKRRRKQSFRFTSPIIYHHPPTQLHGIRDHRSASTHFNNTITSFVASFPPQVFEKDRASFSSLGGGSPLVAPRRGRETAAIMRPGLVCVSHTPGYRKRGVRGYLFRAGRATGAEENALREREGESVCNRGEMLRDTIVPREKHASTRFH